ncbi:Transglycosylase SLT domain-containing protein [Izhakiella capsodis]|uniref:Transglycosylase SLT domain-containing protein n=1 Tax=Izhakiella capsodis TaxID=1367852 RepID=A0A1I4XUZ0_9GAMM|nr:lytic transglycosylase domain-containing protein [Izhakiella capsodis]SFN29634.1 Transglycosylase SLT domain-containing protein [Izhakiella capsodis]
MIIDELAYKVTIKADEFLNGKRKVSEEVRKLKNQISDSSKGMGESFSDASEGMSKSAGTAVTAFRGLGLAFGAFLALGAGLVALKGMFQSTAESIVKANNMARLFGGTANNVIGVRNGFARAGLDGESFLHRTINSRLALANINNPTIFGGLTGDAQNLLTIGARTGIDIQKLGNPQSALKELQRYGRNHSTEDLMQTLSALGYNPNDASGIKSGKLTKLVDEETRKSKLTAEQIQAQEKLLSTLKGLDTTWETTKNNLTVAFGPWLVKAMNEFNKALNQSPGEIEKAIREFTSIMEQVGVEFEAIWRHFVQFIKDIISRIGSWIPNGKAATDKMTAWMDSIDSGAHKADAWLDSRAKSAWNSISGPFGTMLSSTNGNVTEGQRLELKNFDMGRMMDSVRQVESSGGVNLFSPSGAVGDYQLMPGTAKSEGLVVANGIDERLDPQKSRAAAQSYLSKLLKMFDGNVGDALTAYNWGPGNTRKWIDQGRGEGFVNNNGRFIKRPTESLEYAGKVMSDYNMRGMQNGLPPYNKTHSTVITNNVNKVEVNQADASTVGSITKSLNNQLVRSRNNQAFASAVK